MTAAFFDAIRPHFGGTLSQSQVDGFNAIFEAWRRSGDGDSRKLAYLLATTEHETARTMQPIYERGKRAYFDKYEPGTDIGKVLGNTEKGDGYRYRGRGFVQLTGRGNYRSAGARINADLVGNPDLALDIDTAAMILVKGCMEGWFTTRKIGTYINADKCDYRNARRVVNGLDKADVIASYALTYEAALAAAEPVQAPQPVPAPSPPPVPSQPVRGGWLAALVSLVLRVLGAVFRRGC